MTIEDAGRQFSIETKDLRYYEKQGILKLENLESGCREREQSELKAIQLIDVLAKIGIEVQELRRLKELIDQGAWTKEDQMCLLRKCRFQMLDDIHLKQQRLDRMDYIIYTMKQEEQRFQNGGQI